MRDRSVIRWTKVDHYWAIISREPLELGSMVEVESRSGDIKTVRVVDEVEEERSFAGYVYEVASEPWPSGFGFSIDGFDDGEYYEPVDGGWDIV